MDNSTNVSPTYFTVFGLPTDIIAATLDSIGINEIADLESKVCFLRRFTLTQITHILWAISQIPNNIAQGTRECLARCGIQKMQQPTGQRQVRVAANALPSGYSGPPPPAPPPAAPTATSPGDKPTENFNNNSTHPGTADENINHGKLPTSLNDKRLKSLVIALLIVNGIFILGTLAALFYYLSRKRDEVQERIRDSMGSEFAPLHIGKTEFYDPYSRTPSPGVPEKS